MESNGLRRMMIALAGALATESVHVYAQDVGEPATNTPAVGGVVKPADDLESLLNLDIGALGNVSVDPFSSNVGNHIAGGSNRQMSAESLEANYIGGHEAASRNTTDAGNLLGKSHMNPGVYIQQRNPIISDPRIRGYRFGQYLASADGAAWIPARLDLDAITSKIDSKMIKDVVIINGPYSTRYGPGFAFIDIATRDTPRYQGGPDWNGTSS